MHKEDRGEARSRSNESFQSARLRLETDRELDSGCYVLLLLSLKRLAYIRVQVFFLFPRDLTTQSLSYVSHYRFSLRLTATYLIAIKIFLVYLTRKDHVLTPKPGISGRKNELLTNFLTRSHNCVFYSLTGSGEVMRVAPRTLEL